MILAVGLEPVEERGWYILFQADAQVYTPRTGHAVVVWNHCFYLMGGQGFRAKRLMDFGGQKPAVWGRRWLPTFFFWDSQDGNFPSIMTRQPFEPSNIPQLVDSRGEWNATLYGEYEIADEILIEIPSPTSWGEIILLVAIALPFALALMLSPMKELGF